MGFVEGLVDSIFQPGVNKSLLVITNVAFGCLTLVLALIGVLVEFNIHVFFLFFLGLCLWMAINWYIIESGSYSNMENREEPAEQTEQETSEDKKTQ